MYRQGYRLRFAVVLGIFLFFFVLIITRLFYIQFFHSYYLKNLAAKQHNSTFELEPNRGTIYDRNLKPLAANVPSESLYACPNRLKDKNRAIKELNSILGLDVDFLKNRLFRNKFFIWLQRKLDSQKAEQVRSLNIEGLSFVKETKRSYPDQDLVSHIVGYAGMDNIGLEGIELYYNSYLRGKSGLSSIVRDAKQQTVFYQDLIRPMDGYDVVLTIDEVIQYIAKKHLEKAVRDYKAKAAMIVVLEPSTGKILALVNKPDFDINDISNTDIPSRRNRAICDLFEPGSVFKIVTAAASLEEGLFKEGNRFFCENGSFKVAGHILHDHRPHGWLTFTGVFEQSSNIGVAKIASKLGANKLYEYIKKFGFGSKTGVDLPGESAGISKPPKVWSKTSISIIPMGQEIGVTALQLASGISVIANGGFLLKPYIVDRIQDKNQEIIKQFKPKVVHRAIQEETAKRVKDILVGVIENGTGKMAKIDGIKVAGKTGTAQKLEPNGTYSHSKFMASFIGFAPADEPKIAIVVIVDEPRPYYFGGVVAAPVFKNVAKEVLSYLEVKNLEEQSTLYEAKRTTR